MREDLEINHWVKFSEKRPTEPGLYMFFLPKRDMGGMITNIKWVDEVCLHGMGYSPSELWPRCSSWDGYQRTIPNDLMWRYLGEGEKKGDYEFSSIYLSGCPFCGQRPKIEWSSAWIGAPIFKSYEFKIKCNCGMASTGWLTRNLKSAVQRWNKRVPEKQLTNEQEGILSELIIEGQKIGVGYEI